MKTNDTMHGVMSLWQAAQLTAQLTAVGRYPTRA
uniref:Uncharacterized protein n=1 Tax=Anguilla anguilla TaxID=7936 RepID=A0A0E9RH28_ANGAN